MNQLQVSKVEEKRLRVRTSLTEDELRLISDIRRAD
jgi:hypothetical protein